MNPASISISLTMLSNSTNYIDLYDVLQHQRIITVLELKDKSLIILLSSGKIIRYNPQVVPGKLYVESIWEQFITYEVVSAVLSEDYPCIFYLSNQQILYLKSNEGDITTAKTKDLVATTISLYQSIFAFFYNSAKNLLVGLSENHIQVLALNPNGEMVPFAPFQPSCQKFVCENCVFFSKRHENILYYLDSLQEPTPDNINFSKEPSTYYILKKCVVDSSDISEAKLHIMSYESEMVSVDINIQEVFIFLTKQQFLYILKGTKSNGVKVLTESKLAQVKWNCSSTLVLILSTSAEIFVFDSSLNHINIISNSFLGPCFPLNSQGLLGKIHSFMVSNILILASPTNVALCKILDNSLIPIPSHLRQGNFTEALGCLDTLPLDSDFALGFYLCWKFVCNNLEIEYVKALENVWTKNCHSRMPGATGTNLLLKLGYKLLHSGHLEPAFLLGRKLRNIRLLNDISYYADSKGFKGLALLAKHEREMMDEEYISPCSELENLVKITGKTMSSSDYCLLLSDFEEILSISRVNEALSKGGYLEEKNFWEIDLEAYASGLILEGEGKFEQALEIYKSQNLTNEINRINLIVSQQSKSLTTKEMTVEMEEVKE